MQISFKNLKVIGESPGNDWEKWEKSKTKTNLSFLLHFMLTWHLSESMFCHLNMCCALFCIFCARLRLEPKKSDSNITLVNRRPMGKWYIYIYILDDASQSQHPLQFTLTRLWPDTWAGLCRPATLNTTQLNKLIYSNNPKTSKTVKVPRMCHVKIQCLFFSARTPLSGSGLWFMSFRSFREIKSSWEAWGTLVPNQRFYHEQHDF